ncbi:electron transfer flavoprotein subunit alpha/FixB family protein [Sporolactobacillus sp. KGMB 08714]|uniref:electron transfer flavoprotein subunit alpha/FixB family protein n=1 Tax=Sporolactobacillus sp. KGMB 08714 TaxID=3064704 RepID=UPI002FBDAB1E
MKLIWVITETANEAFGFISKASEMGEKIAVFTGGTSEQAAECYKYGASEVTLLKLPEETLWEQYAVALAPLALREKPELILISATKRGKTLAAYLGGLIDGPVLTEIKSLKQEEGKLLVSRAIYGGLAEKQLVISMNKSVIVTADTGSFNKKVVNDTSGNVAFLSPRIENSPVLLERTQKEKASVNLADADIVIGVGRGFGSEGNIRYAKELADLLGGEVACSRPVTEDLHWMPEERYLGISGQVIKPDLYLCAGISGQIQHVYGIRDAKRIVAINKDENAPIFKVSDYYIVGDLVEILPEISAALK